MRTLRVIDIEKAATDYLLKDHVGTCYTIGRAAACRIFMPEDSSLSQQHCSVTVTEEGITIRDLGSTNGTFRGKNRISEEIMKPGVEYTIGNSCLILLAEPGDTPAAPSPNGGKEKQKEHPAAEEKNTPPPTAKPGKSRRLHKEKPSGASGEHHATKDLSRQGATTTLKDTEQTSGTRRMPHKPGTETLTLSHPTPTKNPFSISKLLVNLFLGSFAIGILVLAGCGCYFLMQQFRKSAAPPTLPAAPVTAPTAGDASAPQGDDGSTDDEEEPEVEDTTPAEPESPDTLPPDDGRDLPAQEEDSYAEEEVPEDPKQNAIPPSRPHAQYTASLAKTHQLIKQYEKTEKTPFFKNDLPAGCWHNPFGIYQRLTERTLAKLKNYDEKGILRFLESPANRLDLARLTLIRRVGTAQLKAIADEPRGAEMLGSVMRDLNWCNGLLHSGPMKNGEAVMRNLLIMYTMDRNAILEDEVLKKTATAIALEIARMKPTDADEDVKERYNYYATSYKERKLNALYATLQYWDMRFVLGFPVGSSWGSVKNMTWLRDNVRLPAERYLGSEGHIHYRIVNVAGDSIFSADSIAPIAKYTNGILAWQHREMGGVCAHLSSYASYAALAAGLPSATVGEPDHLSYVLRVGNEWKPGNSIFWEKSISRNPWNKKEWDFLMLMQALYEDRYTTLVSDELGAMADFLAARKKYTAAFNTYELALKVQPLNWPGYERYAGYLKLKAPEHYDKWRSLHDFVLQGIGKKYYCAAGHLLVDFVYPGLGPLMKQSKERNKLFASFFRNINDWGTNRWNITPLLDAQIAYCQNIDERKDFLHDALFVLMQKPLYTSPVLMWGNHYLQQLTDEKEKDRFADALFIAMSRTRMGNPKNGKLWEMFCNCIAEAEATRDREAFQMIGRLARLKCQQHFPKTRARVPRLRGQLLSEKGSICRNATHMAGDACLHWSVLHATGGSFFTDEIIPSCQDIVVQLEKPSHLTGVVLSLNKPMAKSINLEGFTMEISDNGTDWVQSGVVPTYDNKSIVIFDGDHRDLQARFVRLRYHYDSINGISLSLNAVHVYGTVVH